MHTVVCGHDSHSAGWTTPNAALGWVGRHCELSRTLPPLHKYGWTVAAAACVDMPSQPVARLTADK